MGKSRSTKQVNVGNDFEGNLIQGNHNNATFINNELDSEDLSQSLSEAISDVARETKWEQSLHDSIREESREILETVFVAFVSGISIGIFWKFAFPWNAETTTFFIIATILVFNILRLTHFGIRRSIMIVMFLGTAYTVFLRFTTVIHFWMDTNQFVGTTILGTLGAIGGLITGFILLFWKPLGD